MLGLSGKAALSRVERVAGDRFDERGGSDFQRGAAGKPAAERHGGGDQHFQRPGIHTAFGEQIEHAVQVDAPRRQLGDAGRHR